jgi:hypothetical protein
VIGQAATLEPGNHFGSEGMDSRFGQDTCTPIKENPCLLKGFEVEAAIAISLASHAVLLSIWSCAAISDLCLPFRLTQGQIPPIAPLQAA